MENERVERANRLRPWMMAMVVLGVVLASYWPALKGGLVWDDEAHVTRLELRSWSGLGRIWWEVGATQQYYPILHSAFWIEHRLWGDATLGYHLVNVGLHVTACCLLALMLRRLWRINPESRATSQAMPVGAEWLAALLFAVHPVCVESVAWISEQKNTLSLVFYFLAGLAYLDFNTTRRPWSYGRATLFFVLALGTKSVTASLPAALLVMLWWRNGKLSWRDIRPLIPWFIVALVAGLFTAWIERKLIGAEGAAFDFTLGQRVLLAGRVIWFYVGKLVWPANLMFVYPHWDLTAGGSYWYLVGAIGVTVFLWSLRRRTRGPLAAWLFFGGSLFPVLGFFNVYPFIFSYIADHFQYLPALGLIAGAATGIAWLLAKAPPAIRTSGWALCAGAIAWLMIQSNRQSRIYTDSETLYRQTLARNPDSWMALNNLALELVKSPEHEAEAIALYENALRVRPDYAEAHNNLGVELAKIPNRVPEAIAHYEQALRIQPNYAEAHSNLASALGSLPERASEALKHLEQAVRLKPTYPEVHYNLANALANLPDRFAEALMHYQSAIKFNPGYVEAHYNLANLLAKLPGREPEAIAQYERTLQLEPDYADAWVALANLLTRLPGRETEAMAQYEAALRIKPDVAGVHYNLAVVLAKFPERRSESLTHFEEALRLQPDYAAAHVGYAAELAKQPERVPEAIAHYEAALRINPEVAEVHYALGVVLSNLPRRLADAQLHYEEALRLKPDYAAAHNNLATIYARRGRLAEARQHWEKALQLVPDYEDARKNLKILDGLQAR